MAWSLIVTYRLPSMRTECTPNTSNLVASDGPMWYPILFAKEEGAATGIDVVCAIKGPDVADDEVFDITPRIFHASVYGETVIPSECRLLVARKKDVMSFPPRSDGGPGPGPIPTFPEYTVRPCDGMVEGLVHVWHPVKAEFNGAKQRPLYRISLVATRRSNGESSEAPASPPFVWQVKASDSSRLIDEAGLPILGERLKPLRQTGGNPRLEGIMRSTTDTVPLAGTRRGRNVEDEAEAAPAAASAAAPDDTDFSAARSSSNGGPKRPRVVPAEPVVTVAVPAPRPKPVAPRVPPAAGSGNGTGGSSRAASDALSRLTLLYLGQLAAKEGWYSDTGFAERVRGTLQTLPRSIADDMAGYLPGVPAVASYRTPVPVPLPPSSHYPMPFGSGYGMPMDATALLLGGGNLNPGILTALNAARAAGSSGPMGMGMGMASGAAGMGMTPGYNYGAHAAPAAAPAVAYPGGPEMNPHLEALLEVIRNATQKPAQPPNPV